MSFSEDVIAVIQSGNMEHLRQLLSRDPCLAATRDASGVSAIMNSVYRGRIEAVDLLRKCDLSLDIFEAAAVGDTTRLLTLIRQDPSTVNGFTPDGFTALHLASYFSQTEAARSLLEHGASAASVARNPTQVTPLHSAATGRNLDTARDLLQYHAPVNARQQQGWTALHSAAQNGQQELVVLLLQHGADPSLKNDAGVTAADVARKAGHPEVADQLASSHS